MSHTIKIIIKVGKTTELLKRVSIATSSIKELNVVSSAWWTPTDTKWRVIDYEFNSPSSSYFNDPFTLKILLRVAIGVTWRMETAIGCIQ